MHLRTKGYIFPKKIINREILTYTIPVLSFPDFDAARCTFIGLNHVFSSISTILQFVSCNLVTKGFKSLTNSVAFVFKISLPSMVLHRYSFVIQFNVFVTL